MYAFYGAEKQDTFWQAKKISYTYLTEEKKEGLEHGM